MSPVIFGYDKQTRCLLVNSVHNTGPQRIIRSRESNPPPQEGIYKGSGGISGSRMHDHACRLVHDQQCVVFVYDIKRYLFGNSYQRRWFGKMNLYMFKRLNSVLRLDRFTVDKNVPFPDQPLNFTAGYIRNTVCKILIESFFLLAGRYLKDETLTVC